MNKVVVSASGKLHLMGEHAVVYGKPAILTAVSQRLFVTISKEQGAKGQNKKTLQESKKRDAYLNHIVSLVEKKYSTKVNGFFSSTSTIPRGAGMGSSAAFATATIGALMTYLGKPWDVSVINELVFKAEKKIHGKPSGGDNTIIVYGGLLWYRREFEFLKTFWSLPMQFPKSFAPFILVHTGKSAEPTKEMVKRVKSKVKSQKSKVEAVFSDIEKSTKQYLQAIHDKDQKSMRMAIRNNEKFLEQLGVVSSSTKRFIRSIEEAGGVGKVSGAGGIKNGSGIVMCQHDNASVVFALAKKSGFEAFQTKLAQPGVRIEQVLM